MTIMRYIVFICLCISLGACGYRSYDGSIMEIVGNRVGAPVVRGMGVCISDGRVLTSAHVVSDDRDVFTIGGMIFTVSQRDIISDRAYLISKESPGKNPCKNIRKYIGKTDTQKIGDVVSIPVIRETYLQYLTGNILTLTGTILSYDRRGQSRILSGIVLTDIQLLPGDSGAPILDRQGRVIDIVHVE